MRIVQTKGNRTVANLLLVIGLICCPSSPLLAQQNAATIIGAVTDPSGAAISGAKISALNESTGFTRSAESDASGSFVIPLVPIGTYRITGESIGFKMFSRKGVELQLNQSVRITIEMQVGSVAESIEVGAQTPLVDTTSSAGGEVVDRKRIVELPLNGRNPLQLATLLPGVTVSNNPVALTSGNRGGNSVSVNGSRTNETDYQLDGMRFAGGYTNSGLNYPSPDALQEFKLITNSYSAEYGFYAGAIFTAVTRSGTNKIHGSVWEFLRNDKLNARNFFSATVPILRQNQFGASVGFPILKNKLFGFASYQGLRIRGTSIASSFPLTAAERRGLFATPIRDPRTNLPFPNNTIPADRINPVAARLLSDVIPVAPGSESGLLVTSGSNPVDGNHYLGKLDALFTTKDTLSISYFFDKTSFKTPFASGPYPVYGQRQEDQVIPVASANYTRSFTPTLLNQLRVGISGQEENRKCSSGLTPRALGINIDLEGPPEPPSINVTGRFNVGGGGLCLWVEGTRNYQVADSLTWIKGRHQIKAGFDVYRRKFKLITAYGDPGFFGFDGSATGNAAADFLLGELVTATRRPLIDLAMRSINSSFFVQDDFKVSRRLTLNLGLRYELLGPFDETRGVERSTVKIPQNATFRQGVQSTVIPSAPPGLLFTGDKAPDFPEGLPSTMVRLDRKQIQPRIGLAYDLTGDGLTSLRASYGLYSNAHFGDMGAQSFQNQPFLLGQSLFRPAGGLSDPWRGLENPFPRSLDLTTNPNKKLFFLPSEVFGWDPDFVMPRVQALSLGIQRDLFRRLALDVSYVGKLSRHLQDTVNINQARYIPGVDAAGQPLSTLGNTDSRRITVPNTYQKINMIQSGGNASYHSFQTSTKYRTDRLTLLAAYTWSKSIDTGQSTSVQSVTHQNNLNLNGDRGLSDFHRAHVARFSWVYLLPSFSSLRVISKVIGGWEISGITSLVSGAPFSIITGRDIALTATANRADQVGDPNLSGGRTRGELITQFFNKAAFVPNGIGAFGNVGRNSMIGPRFSNTDLGFIKNFGFSERLTMQLRGEIYNTFNQVNFGTPVNAVTAPAFARLTSAAAPRVVQFGLKLNY